MFRRMFGGGVEQQSSVEGLSSGESKLQSIRRQLSQNPQVVVGGEVTDPNPGGYFRETIDMFVAPAKPIFNHQKLSLFMHGLIKGIPPTTVDEIEGNGEGGMRVGTLYYDEPIDPEFSQRGLRRTWVRVYPKSNIARFVAEYQQSGAQGLIEPRLENVVFDQLSHFLHRDVIEKIKRNENLG
jgi:hypothetical protein